MKKALALATALCLLTLGFAGCGEKKQSNQSGADGDVIKIGVFEPATGQNAAGGKQEVLGIRYANTQVPTVTVGGKEYKIKLVEADNQSDNAKGVTAAQSLVSAGVVGVLGSYGSGVSIAAAPTFGDAKIPAIGCSCTNPAVTEGNEYYFRVCFLDPFQGTVMANFAKEKGCKKAAVITELGDDYSLGLSTFFKQAFEKMGGKTVTYEFQTGETNFGTILSTAKSENVDVIFAPSSIQTAPLIIKQAREKGITCPIMAGDTWENQSIIENSAGKATDVFLSTFFDENDTSNPVAGDFVKGFKEYLNSNSKALTENGGNDGVAAVSALGYDAYMVMVEAIKKADSVKSEDIKNAISGVTYDGVTGSISFDENGDAKKDMAYIKTMTDKGFEFIKTQTVK